MEVSKFKLIIKYLFGGIGAVIDYLLDILNNALAEIKPDDRETIQAVLNTTLEVLAVIERWKWLCPTKWQTALLKTVKSVQTVVDSLSDLVLTKEELTDIKLNFSLAVDAWKGPDDETCVVLEDIYAQEFLENP